MSSTGERVCFHIKSKSSQFFLASCHNLVLSDLPSPGVGEVGTKPLDETVPIQLRRSEGSRKRPWISFESGIFALK